MIAVDTNLLVYAHRREAMEHPAAVAAIADLTRRSPRWAIPWPCAHEFVSVCTSRAFGSERSLLDDALEALHVWLGQPGCTTIGETGRHFATFAALCERADLRGGAVHDARIAAICIDHDVDELWSCDRDFSRYPDLSVRNPLIPSLHEPVPPAYGTRVGDVASSSRLNPRASPASSP